MEPAKLSKKGRGNKPVSAAEAVTGRAGKSDSTVRTTGKNKQAAMIMKLDKDMREVATAHLGISPTGCVNCLEFLIPKNYLLQYDRQLANNLTGALSPA